RLHLLRNNQIGRCPPISYAVPLGIIKSYTVPSLLFQTGIIMFSCVYTVGHNRPRRSFPITFAPDSLHGTIFIFYSQIQTECRSRTPRGIMKIPNRQRLMVVPTISQNHSDGICSLG